MNRVFITSSGIILGAESKRGRRIKPEQYEPLLKNLQTRNVDRISKIALASAAMILNSHKSNIENNCGIILGTQFSATESIHNYDMEALEKGALSVNPSLFPNTVLNSPTCQISIQFSLPGPVYTLMNGLVSSLDAIGLGYNFIKTGMSQMVLAGGVDEACELQEKILSGGRDLGEAGGFLLLESVVSEKKVLAEIVAYKSRKLNRDNAETIGDLIHETLASAGDMANGLLGISVGSEMEINYMGASGIVQAEMALMSIASKNDIGWVLAGIDNDRASVIIFKNTGGL